MRPIHLFLIVLFFVGGIWFVGAEGSVTQKTGKAIADETNAFAVDLYSNLKKQEGNLFFSPYSIATALAMTAGGAQEATLDQMMAVLHSSPKPMNTLGRPKYALPIDREMQEAFGKLQREVASSGKEGGVEFTIANAIWPQKDFDILPAFTNHVRKNYESEIQPLDYAGGADAAAKIINGWVEQRTKNRIRDLIKPGILNAATRLVLTNAIYFKGTWADPFKKDLTQDLPFKTGTKEIKVPMMSRKGRYRYAEDARMQSLELPYQKGTFSMIILLPRAVDGLRGVEDSLSSESLGKQFAPVGMAEVQVFIPRFKMTREYGLNAPLMTLGMKDAFDSGRADFSGINGRKAPEPGSLFISDAVHKAFVEVNEEGTEAAAATGIAMGLTSVRMPSEVKIFRADHPFLFLIRHNPTGVFLFMGRVK